MFRILGMLLVGSILFSGCASAAYTKITHVYKVGGREYTVESEYPAGPLGTTQPGDALNSFISSVYPSEDAAKNESQQAQPTPVPQTTAPVPTHTHIPNSLGNQLNNKAQQ